ncbi:hypothetical protein [Aliidongia dinghuensis]|nr:hypothetical protein [Aliidongia dinghuensis]
MIGAVGVAALLGLGGCSSTPEDFTVTGVIANPGASQFANTDPAVDAVLAKQICADGYEKLDEQSVPADKGSFDKWKLRCTQYHVRLF